MTITLDVQGSNCEFSAPLGNSCSPVIFFFFIQVQFTQRETYDSRLSDKSNQSAASKGNIL